MNQYLFNNSFQTGFTTTSGTGTGTISMTGATAKTFIGGGCTFNCTLNQGGAGALTIINSNIFQGITNTVNGTTIKFPTGATNTFTNFGLAGISGSLTTLTNTGGGTKATISKLSGIVTSSYLSINNISATGGATWKALKSTNGGNTLGWIFDSIGNFFLMF